MSAPCSDSVPVELSLDTKSSLDHEPLLAEPSTLTSTSTSATTVSLVQDRRHDFIGFRSLVPTPTAMALEPKLFCGPAYSRDTQSWSTYCVIPSDPRSGRFSINDKNLQTVVHSKDRSEIKAALTEAFIVAEAAGRIHLQLLTLQKGQVAMKECPMVLSGFWLERSLFVTSAHWLAKVDERLQGHNRQMMEDPKASCAYISDLETSKEKALDLDHRAFLWDLDESADVAIFRTCSDEIPPKASIEVGQLAVLPSDCPSMPIWTVAYSSHDFELGDPAGVEFEMQEDKQDPTRHNQIKQEGPRTVFEYLACAYLATLESTTEGRLIKNTIEQQEIAKKPEFSDIFIPDVRALAVGRVLSQKDVLLAEYPPREEARDDTLEKTRVQLHTISSFYGCSGAMIATSDMGDGPRIVGILNGGDAVRPMNIFTAFTEAGIQWIKEAIGAAREPVASPNTLTTS